jgi:hypothetical protein
LIESLWNWFVVVSITVGVVSVAFTLFPECTNVVFVSSLILLLVSFVLLLAWSKAERKWYNYIREKYLSNENCCNVRETLSLISDL